MSKVRRSAQAHEKHSSMGTLVNFNFVDDLGAGETISSVSSTSVSPGGNLSIGSSTISTPRVQVLFQNGKAPFAVTADAATDVLTASSHGQVNGTMCHIIEEKDPSADSCLPGGLSADTQYWIVGADTNTFQLATCLGGPAVDITSAGGGTTKVGIDYVASVTVTTSASQVLTGEGVVRVRE